MTHMLYMIHKNVYRMPKGNFCGHITIVSRCIYKTNKELIFMIDYVY
jgi:hypothetical protein